MSMIAIIPARSGSKGLKDKNIMSLRGKPLLAYSIEAALESHLFDTVIVSTDSEQYAKIAREYGAEVPFLRSEKSSSDTASTRECIIEVLENYKKRGKTFSTLMILQPTSPLRTYINITEAYNLYIKKNAKSVISVCEVEHSPLWCNTLKDDLSMENFISEKADDRRQMLDKYYRINGAIYLHDVKYYLNHKYIYDNTCVAYVMPNSESVDIDNNMDFISAEVIMSKKGI